MESDVEADGEVLPEKPSGATTNVQGGGMPIPGSGVRADCLRNVHLRVRGRYSVPSAQITPAFVRAEVERQLWCDRRHRHRRMEGTRRCGSRGRFCARRRRLGSGSAARAHQIHAEPKARNADPEGVHMSARAKTEAALRNAYRGWNGRVERPAA